MLIGINLTHLNPGFNGGIEHCIRSLLYHFPEIAPQHKYVIFANKAILETIDNLEKYQIVEISHGLENLKGITTELEKKIKENHIDIWWSPLLVLDPLNLEIPSTFLIPDLQHEYYPEFFTKNELQWRQKQMQLSANKANIIFTISENAKEDIINILNIPSEKVVVIYLDTEPWFSLDPKNKINSQSIKEKYQLPDKYLFYPANTWPHKNHINLLKAFKILKNIHPDLYLVFTGKESNAHDNIREFINTNKLQDHVKYLGHIIREDMPYIYLNAEMLVFPSLFEGFGIPLVEAMKSRCPIVASNNTSIPEIAGNAALFFDPNNPRDIAEKINEVLNNNKLREKLIQNGFLRAKNFSYQNSAKSIINTLEQIVNHPSVHAYSYSPKSLKKKISSLDNPLVSIITPSYNQGEFIEDTIKSVLNQSYKNIEYIIIDGGSTDNTLDIIKKYAEKYPKQIQWVSEKDHGQSNAINKGLKRTTGDIVAWLNSDDIYNPQAVKKIVSFFKTNSDIFFVHGQGYHVDRNGKYIENYPSKECGYVELQPTCPICQPTAFWRCEILDKIGYLDEDLNYAMDYDYWIRISKKYKLGFIPDHLASTRFYAETKTSGQSKQCHKEILKIINSHYESVHAHWIYAYAHTYKGVASNDKKSILRNLWAAIILVTISSYNFLKYNHSLPIATLKLFPRWILGSIRTK